MKSDHDKLAYDVADRVAGILTKRCQVGMDTCNLIFDRLADVLLLEDDKTLVDLLLGLSSIKEAKDYIALDPVTGEQCAIDKQGSLIYRRFV